MERERRYFVGLDLGQAQDWTALAVLERPLVGPDNPPARLRPAAPAPPPAGHSLPRGRATHAQIAARSNAPFVVLTEGAPDALRVKEAGCPEVASLGADLTATQAEKLAALNKQVLVAFDNDEAGREGAVKAGTRLHGKKAWARAWSPPKHYKDMGDVPRQEVVAWVED